MANSITSIVRPVETEAEIEARRLERVRTQTAIDADGIVEGMKLLQAMHDKGLLEILVALFDRGDKVMSKLVDILSTPGATNALQTALAALQGIGKIDGAAVAKSLDGVAAGVDRVANAQLSTKPMSVFELLKQLRDPDVSAALRLGLEFLKGVGNSVRQQDEGSYS
ncbi:DUF1641 domain-containing protein [Alicyclobacillus fastidiosus]|uniref:DUF1641 domain-containing protein n=1 Tax=Alicyclobacillus fastidiosus TaxID=392011 RepID=A0ABY6ZG79_9BACL|nr:DUF1641 domain-containing protein [Alicyclobacillus fastidiosus]WAH41120.1 DUF1641 domain-containing protein [Alicyclobacillus fastidiosus]